MMKRTAPVLIVGQGLAGTLLAWALERRGRDFFVADAGHDEAASRVGAGLVNPVTGLRWTATPGWERTAARARTVYRGIERDWCVAIVSDLNIRRAWHDATEAARVRRKIERGALAPWARPEALEPGAAWIEGAWRVDLPALLEAGRQRWVRQGRLRAARVAPAEAAAWPGPVLWCVGAAEERVPGLRAVGGETLELEIYPGGAAWRDQVVRHDGVWVLPLGGGRAWAGASFLREEAERAARREELRASVRRQLADLEWRERAVLAGRRMTTPDRRPLGAWLPGREGREGVLNGLGSKGALLAPALAEEWAARLCEGRAAASEAGALGCEDKSRGR